MLSIFSTPVFIRRLWQLKTAVFLHWCLKCVLFCDFSLNKSCETSLGPMLPPGGRTWQLIYPNWSLKIYGAAKSDPEIGRINET